MFYPRKCSYAALLFSILSVAHVEVLTSSALAAASVPENKPDPAIALVLKDVDRLLSQGSFLRAENVLVRALKDHPDDFRLTLEQGQLLRTTGRVSRSRTLFQALHTRAPMSAEPLIALSQIALDSLAPDDALKYAREAIALAPDSRPANLALAAALISDNNLVEANQRLNLLAKKSDRCADVCYLRYQLLMREEKNKEAVRALEEAVKLNPGDSPWLLELSALYKQEGDYDSSLETINRYIHLNPSSIEALSRVANLYEYNFHDYDKAILAYQQILKIDPDIVDALAGIDRCNQKGNDLAAAMKDQLWKFLRNSRTFQDTTTKPPGK